MPKSALFFHILNKYGTRHKIHVLKLCKWLNSGDVSANVGKFCRHGRSLRSGAHRSKFHLSARTCKHGFGLDPNVSTDMNNFWNVKKSVTLGLQGQVQVPRMKCMTNVVLR